MTQLGVPEGESEAEKDGIRESGCWQFLAKPPMPPLGNTWIYVLPRNRPPHPQGSGSPNQVGSLEGRQEAGGGRREAGGRRQEATPPQDALGPRKRQWPPSFTRNSWQPRLAPGVEPGAPVASGVGEEGGGGREVVGGGRWWGRGQASSISQPKEGRGRLGSARVGVKGKEVPAEGRALMWKEALTQAEGRPKTKLGNLNLTLF